MLLAKGRPPADPYPWTLSRGQSNRDRESEGYELALMSLAIIRRPSEHTGGKTAWSSRHYPHWRLIAARWHIHTNPIDAKQYALENGEQVDVEGAPWTRLLFCSVVVRIDPSFVTEMHIDTDQADLRTSGMVIGELMLTPVTSHVARIRRRTALMSIMLG